MQTIGKERFACRHAVWIFYAVTLLFSWTLWLLMILSAKGVLPFRFPTNFTGSFGPAVGALVAMSLSRGKTGVRSLLRSIVNTRFSLRYWLLSLAGPFLLYGIALAAAALYLGAAPQLDLSQWYFVFPILLVLMIAGGPLGEEVGWRGFLLPELLRKYSPIVSTAIVALLWFVWHLPLFYLQGAAQEGGSIGGYALFFGSVAIMFTWLYGRTGGSTLAAILLHTGVNTASFCYPFVAPGMAKGKEVDYIFLAITWLVALILLAWKGLGLGCPRPAGSAAVQDYSSVAR